jgi:hypothetical protein
MDYLEGFGSARSCVRSFSATATPDTLISRGFKVRPLSACGRPVALFDHERVVREETTWVAPEA